MNILSSLSAAKLLLFLEITVGWRTQNAAQKTFFWLKYSKMGVSPTFLQPAVCKIHHLFSRVRILTTQKTEKC